MFHSCKDFHRGGYYQSVAIFHILNDKIMKYFEVGMTVWDLFGNEGVVEKVVEMKVQYPILVRFLNSSKCYTYSGINHETGHTELFQTAPIITQNLPITKFEHGELVWVKEFEQWYIRYFSHIENGKNYCFSNQKKEGNTDSWRKMRKFNDNPLLTP